MVKVQANLYTTLNTNIPRANDITKKRTVHVSNFF